MQSQVLSGQSNPTYTNTTGQNVRVIINYMAASNLNSNITVTWAGVSATATSVKAIGRNLAFSGGVFSNSFNSAIVSIAGNNMINKDGDNATDIASEVFNNALPTEIMLANGQSFSATCGVYNIVVIPEGSN